ncbi:hypothetical protein [Nocardioides sp. GCM10030258]|uniref:hypothetical protein n=1 Tax=unclassified Nocardioides TaxID=2615069 RepID=UPI00361DFEC2
MDATGHRRQARQDLADRLIAEYTGALPAGQVLATVLRTDRLLALHHTAPEDRMELCEELVRHRLVDRTARAHLPRPALVAT